jgi:DNA-binding transcriptional regulator YhcF (GntR family)
MIRLWLSRETEIPIQEQLGAQIVLGILSRRLKPGERLPSVRALARQIKLHPNTVSAVYRSLVDRGWLKRRTGSGVYVSCVQLPLIDGNVDVFARACFEEGLSRGYSQQALQQAFRTLASDQLRQGYLVVDAETELARILAAELSEIIDQEVPFATAVPVQSRSVCVLVTEAGSRCLPVNDALEHRIIRLNSMQDLLVGRERPVGPALIAVVSRSASVRGWATTLLAALGFSAEAVLLRNPAEHGWTQGLRACDIVAADIIAAADLAADGRVQPLIFRLVSPEFLAELHSLSKSSENDPDTV